MNKTQKIILITLLIILSITVRLQNDHQTDFDSYWLHGQGESIQIHKSALWVYHPASLFGYYPFSYPSGTMFFLATFSELTGLSMNLTVFASALVVGLLVIFFTFLVIKELFNKWLWAYLGALIVSISPIIINYSSFNAGGRIFIMPFYLLLIWTILKWQKTKKWKYAVIGFGSILFSFFIHRTAQFLIIFLLAGFAAWFYQHIPTIWKYIQNHRHYKKHIHPRYEKSKYYLILDAAILVFLAIIIKLADLIMRGRLGHNLTRLSEPAQEIFAGSASKNVFVPFFILILLVALTYIIIRYFKKVNIFKKSFDLFHHHYHSIFERPEKFFLLIIGIFTLFLFIRQFLGQSFYAPSINDFRATELISGTGPFAIFLNLMINYTTSVTPVFIFSFLGFIYFLAKKKRNFGEWFLIFSFVAFSGVLLDKRYVRMFIVPFWSIFIVSGWFYFTGFLRRKILKKDFLINAIHLLMIIILLAGSFSTYIRTEYLGEEKPFVNEKPFWETGQYIRTLGNDFSTVTTKELEAGVVIFASSGVPGGSHNIYYFVDKNKLVPRSLTFAQIKERILNGDKIQNIWFLEDWILGGQYYVGRHAIYLFDRPFNDEINQIIINDYKEKYYIHDFNQDETTFYESLLEVKNNIYTSQFTDIHDINRGRE